jgi:EmrB/QacA subfamily drug resistance transporter
LAYEAVVHKKLYRVVKGKNLENGSYKNAAMSEAPMSLYSEKHKSLHIKVTICLAMFLIPLTITGTGVIITPVSNEFLSTYNDTQWLINSFMVSYAAFMAITGAIADSVGRQRTFMVGLAAFMLGSVSASLAPNLYTLIGFRVLTGIGAAAVTTSGTALMAHHFKGRDREQAFAVFGTSLGIGLAIGPFVAGALVEFTDSWRFFFLSIGIALSLAFAMSFKLDKDKNNTFQRVDWVGGTLFTLALVLTVSAISFAPTVGWFENRVFMSLISGLLCLILFVFQQSRSANPLVDVALFGHARFMAVCTAPVFLGLGYISLLFYLPQFLSVTASMSAFDIGITMAYATVPSLIWPPIVSFIRKEGDLKRLLLITYGFLIIGALLLAYVVIFPSKLSMFLPLFISGSSFGLSLAYLDGAAVSVVDSHSSGRAAGVFNTFRLGSEAITIPAVGALVSFFISQYLHNDTDTLAFLTQGDLQRALMSSSETADHLKDIYQRSMQYALLIIAAISMTGLIITIKLTSTGLKKEEAYA